MLDSPRSSLASTSRSRDGNSEECKDARRSILAASFGSRPRTPSRQVTSLMYAAERSQSSSKHPSRPNRRARSSRMGSIPSTWSRIACLVNQLGITLDTKHKTNTDRRLVWRVIPGGDEGWARGRPIPGGDSDEGPIFLPDPGRGEGVANRCWRVGHAPAVRFRPQIGPESPAADGRNQGRAGGGRRWGKGAS